MTLAFDFTEEVGASSIVSTSWTCQLLPGVGTDPGAQDRVDAVEVATVFPVRNRDGTITNRRGAFSVGTVGGMPVTAVGGNYLLEATANLSPTTLGPYGQTLVLSATVLCYDPARVALPVDDLLLNSDRFREDFPEFRDFDLYSDASINYWMLIATYRVGGRRWGGGPALVGQPLTLMDSAREMFIAHNLVLELQAQQRAARGGPPGVQVGALAGVSGNGAAVSYDVGSTAMDPKAGHWGLTTYGMRYLEMVCMVGADGLQI